MTLPFSSSSRFLPISRTALMLVLLVALPACVKRSRASLSTEPVQATQRQANDQQPSLTTNQRRINIDTAAANELETLPGIGLGMAERIIEHRERFGPFRRTEHLIIVRGISDRRFRALRDLVTVE
jgi:competence ComEA-like helix-hairpin-helix protein